MLLEIESVFKKVVAVFNNRTPTCFGEIAKKDYKQSFVTAGVRGKKKPTDARSRTLLDYANDWQLQVDFQDRKLVFPPHICATSLRPDIVISSAKTCNVILLELTCPAEEGIDAAQLRKENRYAELMTDIAAQGWTPRLFTLEVGARGLVGSRTFHSFVTLGLTSPEARRLCKSLSEIVARCSYAIYLAHSTVVWPHNNDLVISKRVDDDAKVKAPEISLKPEKKKPPAVANIVTLRENGITKLFHFTDASNIPSIEKHGLMSGASLIEKSIESKMNSDEVSRSMDSEADPEDYDRLSFGRNNSMMYQAVAEKRISKPVMLEIKLEVVSRPGVRFSDCNATRVDARHSSSPNIVHFDVVRAKRQGDVAKTLKRFYQAEVLVPSPIPPHLTVFPNKPVAQFMKRASLQKTEVAMSPAPYQNALAEENKAHAPECGGSADGLSENVENAANMARSVSDQAKQKLPERKCGESSVSMLGCLPPELGKGSRSESTDKKPKLSDLGDGSGSLFVDDGCLSHVHESKDVRSCNSLPLVPLSEPKHSVVRQTSTKQTTRHQPVAGVDKIIDKRRVGKKVEYLVVWKRSSNRVCKNTWESLAALVNHKDAINAFERSYYPPMCVTRRRVKCAAVETLL